MNFEKEKKRVTPLSFLQNRQNNLWGFIVTVMGTEIRQYFHTVMPRNSCLHIPNHSQSVLQIGLIPSLETKYNKTFNQENFQYI